MNKLISILVPTYNLGENSLLYLEENLSSINSQTYDNIEIVISDNSTDNEVKNFVENFPFRKDIKVIYSKSDRGRGWGASPNTNNTIDLSTGDYLKVLLQDDKFCNNKAVEIIVSALQECDWCAFNSVTQEDISSNYYQYAGNFPRIDVSYPQALLKGENYIGGPTSVAFKKTEIRMDESLRWLNDTDLYYRFWKSWGPPTIIEGPEPLVCFRVRNQALSNTIPREDQLKEIAYLSTKVYTQ